MQQNSAFDMGQRLAQVLASQAARDHRTASAIRRAACARLRVVLAEDAAALVPGATSLSSAMGRSIHAGFLAGLHSSLYRLTEGRLSMTQRLAHEVGYTVAYLGILSAPDQRYESIGQLTSMTLEAVYDFVADRGLDNPLIAAIAHRGLWEDFYDGVSEGLEHASQDMAPAFRLHLRLVESA